MNQLFCVICVPDLRKSRKTFAHRCGIMLLIVRESTLPGVNQMKITVVLMALFPLNAFAQAVAVAPWAIQRPVYDYNAPMRAISQSLQAQSDGVPRALANQQMNATLNAAADDFQAQQNTYRLQLNQAILNNALPPTLNLNVQQLDRDVTGINTAPAWAVQLQPIAKPLR